MSTLERQENTTAGVVLFEPVYEPNTLLSAGALTYAEGTVLGRITASGKLTHYASGSADGSETPIAVLQNEQVFAGAGDVAINAIIGGQVRLSKLVAHGVGALTQGEVDELRDYTIIAKASRELSSFDN